MPLLMVGLGQSEPCNSPDVGAVGAVGVVAQFAKSAWLIKQSIFGIREKADIGQLFNKIGGLKKKLRCPHSPLGNIAEA